MVIMAKKHYGISLLSTLSHLLIATHPHNILSIIKRNKNVTSIFVQPMPHIVQCFHFYSLSMVVLMMLCEEGIKNNYPCGESLSVDEMFNDIMCDLSVSIQNSNASIV